MGIPLLGGGGIPGECRQCGWCNFQNYPASATRRKEENGEKQKNWAQGSPSTLTRHPVQHKLYFQAPPLGPYHGSVSWFFCVAALCSKNVEFFSPTQAKSIRCSWLGMAVVACWSVTHNNERHFCHLNCADGAGRAIHLQGTLSRERKIMGLAQ